MSALRFHRYILSEIAVPTGFSLLIFTFVLFLGRILKLTEMVINKGVPLSEIGLLFAGLLPAFLVITLPLALLLGVLLGFGRLSADGEIVALKASGISLYGMLKPVMMLAAAVAAITAGLTLYIEPAGNTAFRHQLFQIASNRAHVGLQPRIFNDEFAGLVIYANSIDDRSGRMGGVLIADDRSESIPSTIFADSGQVIADRDSLTLTLRLETGSIHRRPESGAADDEYQVIGFATYDINLDLGQTSTAGDRPRRAKEMSTRELLANLNDPEEDAKLANEFHRRLTFPFAPVLFALLAVPLGIQNQRSGRGGGLALGLMVFLAYYILFTFAETLAEEIGAPAAAAMWLPNLLFLGTGIALLRRAASEQPFAVFGLLRQAGRKRPFSGPGSGH